MKTEFHYDHYFQYQEMKDNIEKLQQKYPHLCKAEIICTTEEKRNVYAVALTNQATGAAEDKPALYIDGNTHAGEVTGSMAAMHTMDFLLSNYGTDSKATQLLDKQTFYIIPRISPDGAETYLSTPYELRSVNRPYKPKEGGIAAQDIDQDGVIRMMRIKSPFGAWKTDPENPGSVLPREPDDTEGTYYNIFSEGTAQNCDALHAEEGKALWGLDFNRNYPFGWCPDPRQGGAGPYPLSNAENKAVVDFVLNHANIAAVATNHTSGGMILYPPGTRKSSTAAKTDIQNFKTIGQMAKETMGYDPISIFDTFIEDQVNYDSGAFDDWCYEGQGIPAYTLELWDLDNRAGVPVDWNNVHSETLKEQIVRFNACMNWVKKNAPQDFLDWKPFNHPVFGDVEIGGFNSKFTVQNPPTSYLQQEVEKTTAFMVRYAGALPNLKILKVKIVKEAEGIWKITASVGNAGFLPTWLCEQARTIKNSKPVNVSIDTAQANIISGTKQQDIGDLSGYSQCNTGVYYYGNIATHPGEPCCKDVSWVIHADDGDSVEICAASDKGGKVSAAVVLHSDILNA